MSYKQAEYIFKNNYHILIYISKKIVLRLEDAEDIVSEEFVKLIKSGIEKHPNPTAFLIVAVKNASLNFIKHKKVEKKYERDATAVQNYSESQIERIIDEAKIIEFIIEEKRRLPPQRRKIFDLLFMKGLDVKEVARIMGISQDTVRVQKLRILEFLRKKNLAHR